MRIVVDVMGSDRGPEELTRGAIQAVLDSGAQIILVGDEERIRPVAKEYSVDDGRIEIVHTKDYITMDEDPMQAVRHKRESSLVTAARLVKEGRASAMVSAGSTGALVTAGVLAVGRMPGVIRPALGTVIPTTGEPSVLLDVGANPDCKPENLVQFAVMGSAYHSGLFGSSRPRIGLLNNGAEAKKGNELTAAAHQLLLQTKLNFIGNVEGRDLLRGSADVIVCDGFTGNIVLKTMEGVAFTIFDMVREAAMSSLVSKIGGALLKPSLRKVRRRLDYTEYGGGPLLGLAGLLVKAHGSSNAKAMTSAVRMAKQAVDSGTLETIRSALAPPSHARA